MIAPRSQGRQCGRSQWLRWKRGSNLSRERDGVEESIMRIAVVGAGGVGGYYGSLLQQSGQDVVFLARGTHLEAMRRVGLRIESVLRDPVALPVRAAGLPEQIGPVDLVLFTVKSYDSAAAAAGLRPLLGPDTAVLTLQNGMDNIDVLSEAVGGRYVLGGLCQIFCALAAPGIIRHTNWPRARPSSRGGSRLPPRCCRVDRPSRRTPRPAADPHARRARSSRPRCTL
jgi:hypothetical protein